MLADIGYGAAWSSVFIFDAMIFGLTVYKTLKIGRTHRRTMVDILLRDGQSLVLDISCTILTECEIRLYVFCVTCPGFSRWCGVHANM